MTLRWKTIDDDPQAALFDDAEVGVARHVGTGEYRGMEFLHVNAGTIVNRVPARSRMPFEYTINPYRGCSHACVYCFARPTHAYLGLGIGDDFDRKIVVKVNAVERARAELDPRRRRPDHIALGTNTDPYQKAEGKYHLTRGLIDVLAASGTPFSILTKSTLILRDVDALVAASRRVDVRVNLSIGTLDAEIWRATEPGTPPPWKRVDTVARLNAAGVRCGVLVGPVLPGLSDHDEQLRATVHAAVGAGAVSVSAIALHLRLGVREHYLAWLGSHYPALSEAYESRYSNGRSYLPNADQHALSARITRFAAEPRGSPPVAVISDIDTNSRTISQGLGPGRTARTALPAPQLAMSFEGCANELGRVCT